MGACPVVDRVSRGVGRRRKCRGWTTCATDLTPSAVQMRGMASTRGVVPGAALYPGEEERGLCGWSFLTP